MFVLKSMESIMPTKVFDSEAEYPEEARVDLNEDGEINTLDHSILLEAFFNNQGS